jgi:2-methylcitrate dehydratase PrpD
VAAALFYGKVGLDHFSEQSVVRPETQALMKKVRITAGEELGGFGSGVIVRTLDGREFSSTLAEPKGSLSFPLTEGELVQKFVDCAMTTMSSSRAEKAGEALMGIEAESNLENIIQLLFSQ